MSFTSRVFYISSAASSPAITKGIALELLKKLDSNKQIRRVDLVFWDIADANSCTLFLNNCLVLIGSIQLYLFRNPNPDPRDAIVSFVDFLLDGFRNTNQPQEILHLKSALVLLDCLNSLESVCMVYTHAFFVCLDVGWNVQYGCTDCLIVKIVMNPLYLVL